MKKGDREDWLREVGSRLKLLRKQLGYDQDQMGSRLGVTRSGYFKNENGRAFPGIDTMHRLKTDLDISMDWLIFGRGPMHYTEVQRMQEAETRAGSLQKELEQAREKISASEQELKQAREKISARENDISRLTGMGDAVLTPEVKEMLDQMANIPLLYYETMAHYHRFKLDHKTLTDQPKPGKRREKEE
ncbi:MAG: helix-turn-helix transcriptional regulator [bacterium]|nr:helix-turn-helix transcriptional regulator [bacterium]